jgi:hypothetical protein
MTRIRWKTKFGLGYPDRPQAHAAGKSTSMLRRLLAILRPTSGPTREVVLNKTKDSQLENQFIPLEGTTTFIWHDGSERFEVVTWDPRQATRDVAYEIALRRMASDPRATRVRIDFGETTFVEVSRPCNLSAGSLRVITEGKAE